MSHDSGSAASLQQAGYREVVKSTMEMQLPTINPRQRYADWWKRAIATNQHLDQPHWDPCDEWITVEMEPGGRGRGFTS